jgi:hypothetical protein
MTRTVLWTFLLFVVLTMTGCQAIMQIFEAGMWVGVIGVIILIGLVVMLIRMFRR